MHDSRRAVNEQPHKKTIEFCIRTMLLTQTMMIMEYRISRRTTTEQKAVKAI